MAGRDEELSDESTINTTANGACAEIKSRPSLSVVMPHRGNDDDDDDKDSIMMMGNKNKHHHHRKEDSFIVNTTPAGKPLRLFLRIQVPPLSTPNDDDDEDDDVVSELGMDSPITMAKQRRKVFSSSTNVYSPTSGRLVGIGHVCLIDKSQRKKKKRSSSYSYYYLRMCYSLDNIKRALFC